MADPEVTRLVFNYQSTLLVIGDKSGRVLVWSLQQMAFLGEFLLGKQINVIHCHPISKMIFVSVQNASFIIDIDCYQVLKSWSRGYYGLFTPLKNYLLVGVRATGFDAMDLRNFSDNVFFLKQIDYNFKLTQCCGERKTSTIPQILTMQGHPDGAVQIDVITLK